MAVQQMTPTSLLSFALAVFLPLGALGSPTPISLEGVAAEGQTLTVRGASFGQKSPAAPLIFADFEHGSHQPSNLGRRDYWDVVENLSHHTGNQVPGSTGNVMGEWDAAEGKRSFSFKIDKEASDGYWTEIYHFQKRFYSFDSTDNQKFWRLWPASGGNNFLALWQGNSGLCYNESEGYIGGTIGGFQGRAPEKNQWHVEEFVWTHSGGTGLNSDGSPGGGNGRWLYVRDGTIIQQRENVNNGLSNMRELRTDNFTDSGAAAPDGSRVYMDDIYIDDSLARVMIGNHPTLAGSTKREIQIPIEWTSGEIQFQFRTGEFSNGDEVYLFVFDPNGSPNPQGLPIKIGTAYDGQETSVTPDVTFDSFENVVRPAKKQVFSLDYSLSKTNEVKAFIIDQTGTKVKTLVDAQQGPGARRLEWDGTNSTGRLAASGYYALLFKGGNVKKRFQIVVIK